MRNGLLVKYGEIAIRGKNRYIFEAKLIRAIKRNIESIGPGYYIKKEQGRLLIVNNEGAPDFDKLIPRVLTVFGIIGVCPCIITENQEEAHIKSLALAYFKEQHGDCRQGATFKVVTKRANKKYPLTSNQMSAEIGELILNHRPDLHVQMKQPEITLHVELRTDAYIYSQDIKGLGGLPPGSSGKGVLLLSGGIDSPVAGFMMGKRGVELTAVYFHSPPYTSQRAKEKVIDLAKQISVYTGEIKLHIIPFTQTQLYLYDRVPAEKMTIFLKRAMLQIADRIALQESAHCVITGDSVGQVASQTLMSLRAVESATTLPILRPLTAFDKQEIVDIAKNIGTFETSILPYEDCCTIFVAEHPETKPKASVIEKMESKMAELDGLLTDAIENVEIIDI